MLKYVQSIDEETGLVKGIGQGNNERFYMSKRMKKVDIKQSDIDGNWYLSNKCPMKSEEEKEQERIEREEQQKQSEKQKRINEIKAELEEIDKQSQRSTRAISLCILNEETPNSLDIEKLTELENKAEELREELQGLEEENK